MPNVNTSGTVTPWLTPFLSNVGLQPIPGGVTTWSVNITGTIAPTGCDFQPEVVFYAADGVTQVFPFYPGPFLDVTPFTWVDSGSIPAGAVYVGLFFRRLFGPINTTTYSVVGDFSPLSFCEYGTQMQPFTAPLIQINGAFLEIALLAEGVPALLATALAVIPTVVTLATVCANQPPPMPTITAADFEPSVPGLGVLSAPIAGKVAQIIDAYIWSQSCQCTPAPGGMPAPTMPPAPSLPPITFIQPPVTIPCDETDLCTLQNNFQVVVNTQIAIAQTVNNLTQQISNITNYINNTTVNNNPVPPVAVGPPSAPATSGTGSALGIHGVVLSLTTVPAWAIAGSGSPAPYFHAGFVHVGNDLGWRVAIAVHVTPMWIDFEPGDDRYSWSLTTGFQATATEYRLAAP